MGFIKSSLFMSLDGVVEAPNTWHFPYFDDEMGQAVGSLMGESEATLLGRNTYDEFVSYWPSADPSDPMTDIMNGSRKYVVTDSLDEAAWQNTTIVTGDVASQLAKLRDTTNLTTTGSGTLVRWLMENELVDELHLLVHPVVLGHGKRLFTEGATVPLTLLTSTAFGSGVLHLVYGRGETPESSATS